MTAKPQEVRVERDPETGKITKVIQPEQDEAYRNPLNDPLNELSDEEDDGQDGVDYGNEDNIIAQLEAQAAQEAELEAKRKRPRQQSAREEEWLANLVKAHGDDTMAMSRDRKLNPMQQSEGDIKKRLKKWKQKHG